MRISSFLPPRGFQESNSDLQTLPTEPSCWPGLMTLLLHLCILCVHVEYTQAIVQVCGQRTTFESWFLLSTLLRQRSLLVSTLWHTAIEIAHLVPMSPPPTSQSECWAYKCPSLDPVSYVEYLASAAIDFTHSAISPATITAFAPTLLRTVHHLGRSPHG